MHSQSYQYESDSFRQAAKGLITCILKKTLKQSQILNVGNLANITTATNMCTWRAAVFNMGEITGHDALPSVDNGGPDKQRILPMIANFTDIVLETGENKPEMRVATTSVLLS